MPSELYDLGVLEHIHNGQNLKLRTSISITLSFPDHLLLVPPNLDTIISSNVWVSGANRVHLVVRLSFGDVVMSDSAGRDIVEDVGRMLCQAEVVLLLICMFLSS